MRSGKRARAVLHSPPLCGVPFALVAAGYLIPEQLWLGDRVFLSRTKVLERWPTDAGTSDPRSAAQSSRQRARESLRIVKQKELEASVGSRDEASRAAAGLRQLFRSTLRQARAILGQDGRELRTSSISSICPVKPGF